MNQVIKIIQIKWMVFGFTGYDKLLRGNDTVFYKTLQFIGIIFQIRFFIQQSQMFPVVNETCFGMHDSEIGIVGDAVQG